MGQDPPQDQRSLLFPVPLGEACKAISLAMNKRALEISANIILIGGLLLSVIIMFTVLPPEGQVFAVCINPFTLAYLPLMYLFAGSPWLFVTSYGAMFAWYIMRQIADKKDQ